MRLCLYDGLSVERSLAAIYADVCSAGRSGPMRSQQMPVRKVEVYVNNCRNQYLPGREFLVIQL